MLILIIVFCKYENEIGGIGIRGGFRSRSIRVRVRIPCFVIDH